MKPPAGTLIKPGHPDVRGMISNWPSNTGFGSNLYDYASVKNWDARNHGSIIGAIWVPGRDGWTLNFDGTDYIDIDIAINDLVSTTIGSWSVWVKPVDATPAPPAKRIVSFGDADVNTVIQLRLQTSGLIHAQCAKTGITQWELQTDSALLSDGIFSHIALVQDGVEPVIHVDGVKPAQTFLVSTDKTAWFNDLSGIDKGRIGCTNFNNFGNVGFWEGLIDGILLYDRVLSAADLQLYLNPYAMFNRQISPAVFPVPVAGIPIPIFDHHYRQMRAC